MKGSGKIEAVGRDSERRRESRSGKLTNHRAEFKFPGVPVYQLKVRDMSSKGAGIVVRADSNFLAMIQVGQKLDVNLLLPKETGLSGRYQTRIEHISELNQGRFKGHRIVGISLLDQISPP